jgi:hypothetical protein
MTLRPLRGAPEIEKEAQFACEDLLIDDALADQNAQGRVASLAREPAYLTGLFAGE